MAKGNALGGAKARIITLESQLKASQDETASLRSALAVLKRDREAFAREVNVRLADATEALNEYRDENARLATAGRVNTELHARITQLKEGKAKATFFAATLAIALVIVLGSITGGILK
ncbi:hypothetical protein [Escherichia phage vB_EcoP_LHP]